MLQLEYEAVQLTNYAVIMNNHNADQQAQINTLIQTVAAQQAQIDTLLRRQI